MFGEVIGEVIDAAADVAAEATEAAFGALRIRRGERRYWLLAVCGAILLAAAVVLAAVLPLR